MTSSWQERPVVITGAAGFLGRHLIPALSAAGARVLALDLAPAWPGLPVGVDWQRADLMSPEGVEAALAAVPGDMASAVLFHFAALSMPFECAQNPEKARAFNAGMALGVGRAWAARGGGRLVFASSALVYQPKSGGRDISEDDPVEARNPYTEAKIAAEEGVASLADQGGVAVDVVRLSNVYGPDAHPQTVLMEAMDLALAGQSPVMRFPGHELDFVHADDVAQGLLRLIALEHPGGCRYTNISTGQGWRVAQAAGIIARLAGVAPPPDDEAQPGYGYRLVLDNRRLRELTGWAPEVEFRQGLERAWRERTGRGA
ncbi:MAG: NAD(P)-dependent oxidoreductase [Desulfarculaceae bacterium]|nr:NAD(P)-dependent oxidoreductase [Desulfarculaceae bacterium]